MPFVLRRGNDGFRISLANVLFENVKVLSSVSSRGEEYGRPSAVQSQTASSLSISVRRLGRFHGLTARSKLCYINICLSARP